jgi:transposase-like protein
MSLREERRTRPLEPAFDAEEEVDLRRYWGQIAARWWLPVVGLIAGALIGYLFSLGGSKVFRAETIVYVGQPFYGSNQIQNPNANPSSARSILRSESAIQRVARDVGIPPDTLRAGVTATAVQGAIAKFGQAPLISVAVKGPQRTKVRRAANELARILVLRLSGYSRAKIASLTQQYETEKQNIAAVTAALASKTVSSTDKLVLQLRLGQLEDDLTSSTQLLALARNVESPRILTTAAAERNAARSRRNSIVIGAVLGLLLGVAAALLFDRLPARRPRL